MKTPREILLAHHRAAAPKLDAIRDSVVNELTPQALATQSGATAFAAWCLRGPMTLWRELILPTSRLWTGLTAVWLVLIVVNISQRDNVSSVTGKPVQAPAMAMSFQVQQHWMKELIADRSIAPTDADRPKTITPKPRTAKAEPMLV